MAQLESILEELGLAPLWISHARAQQRDAPARAKAWSEANEALQPEAVAVGQPAAVLPARQALDGPVTDAGSERVPMAKPADAIATLDWAALEAHVADCTRCKLCDTRTQTVFGVGDTAAEWMMIGDAPGENEDQQGEPFVGQAGKLLDNMLRSLGLARGANVYIANVLKCRPPGNRDRGRDEVAQCEPYLKRQVEWVKPKVIVALGLFAAQSLLKTEASISSLRGRVHAYEGVPVVVTHHPADLLRSLSEKSEAWTDLCLALSAYRQHIAQAQ
jgi:uracil-DNA glycosylase family 4